MSKKIRINSIRLYYLDSECRIVGERKEVYGMDRENLLEHNYVDPGKLERFALRKLKVDKKRDFKFEVRTTRGRFLFSK